MTAKKKVQISDYDPADYLSTKEEAALYLQACIETGETAVILAALRDIAKAYGMTTLADKTGISRQGLYKALSESGNPSFDMVLKITNALDIPLAVGQ